MQEAFYRRGYARVHGRRPGFVFIFVEKTPPHLVRCVELDAATQLAGGVDVDDALTIWRDCRAAGMWPGRTGIGVVGLPRWARRDDL